VLTDLWAHGYQAGLYLVAAWAPGMSGAHFAKYASDHLQRLTPWGYPPNMLHPFYDGARLPADARDGCVFTAERIP
jgi:hypothetical protein